MQGIWCAWLRDLLGLLEIFRGYIGGELVGWLIGCWGMCSSFLYGCERHVIYIVRG